MKQDENNLESSDNPVIPPAAPTEAKPRDTRWMALAVVTIIVFVVQFALCAFAAPCNGMISTLICTGDAASCGNIAQCVTDGSLDLNQAIAGGTCTIGAVPMKCHWSYGASAGMALFGVLAGLGMLRLPGVHGRRFAGILAMCAAVGAAAYPAVVFGTCSAPMVCASMVWPVLALSAIGALCGVLAWPWCKPRKPSRGI